jgi:hypothetical protein
MKAICTPLARRLLPALFAMLLALPAASQAATIIWGSAVGDYIVTSTDTLLDDTYTFEMGTFGSFVPNENNMDDWLTNWKVFDRATYANGGWDPGQGFFSSEASLLSDGTSSKAGSVGAYVFTPGEQAFIWVFNSTSMVPGSEWALITNNSLDGNPSDNWVIPAVPDPCNCGSPPVVVEWRLGNSSLPLFGGVNDDQGPGIYSVDPPAFALQTHVIPEPSGSLLILLAAAVVRLRRLRDATR